MKVALIGDIHANLTALEAVLAHAQERGATAIWNIGDFVGYGPCPDEVVRRLQAPSVLSIVGNYDTAVLRHGHKGQKKKNPAKVFARRWAYENLSPRSKKFLSSLDEQVRMEVQGRRILLTHGSPASPDEHLTSNTPQDRLNELAETAQADIIVCGHSHEPFVRRADGVWFINTGSVGRPDDGDPRASYALLEVTPEKMSVRHFRVEYDVAQTVAAMRRKQLPESFIGMILQGRSLDEVQDETTAKVEHSQPPSTGDSRLAGVLQLASSCHYEQGHTDQVTRLALVLFDKLKSLHKMGRRERFWLQCAAILHDIGWIEGGKAHHKTAQRLILSSPLLPLRGHARQIVACIARYHRKGAPLKKHLPYGELAPQDGQVVRTLSAILRVADGLDVAHDNRVTDVSVEIGPGEVVLYCTSEVPLEQERSQVRKKGRLFEERFKRKLEIQWHHA